MSQEKVAHEPVGEVAESFEAVRSEFASNLRADADYSAQLAVYWRGQKVVDLVGGPHLGREDLSGVFSATKGVAAVALGSLVRDGRLDLDARVVKYWPEFAAHGKDALLVRELLSHRAGLLNVEGGLTADDLLDSRGAAAKLAAARPVWRPGTAFGYHGITIGVFMEELTRRVSGSSLQDLYERDIRAPRAIPFWLGLPAEEEPRFREALPAAATVSGGGETGESVLSFDSTTAFAFNSMPGWQESINVIGPNSRRARAVGFTSTAGIGSAVGLAQVYAAALGDLGEPVLDEEAIAAMAQQQSWGEDRVLGKPMCFGIVFMKPQPRMEFGSWQAFGHDGAGGALGFADPYYEVAFGYIPRPMQVPAEADARAIRLAHLVRDVIRRRL